MGKVQKTNAQPFNKTKVLKDIRQRNLKVVLYRNKYFPNDDKNRKSELIKELLYKERKILNLHEEEKSCNLDSEDEENIAEGKRLKLLEQKKSYLFASHSDSDFSEPPAEILKANKKWKEQQKQEKVVFPVIPKNKIDKFFSVLSSSKTVNTYEKNLNQCFSYLYVVDRSFWNSPSCVLKAIKDSILKRKWNNLPQLLLMLIHLHTSRFRPLIRHICQIMAKLHPGIQEAGLQDQFEILHQVHRRNR